MTTLIAINVIANDQPVAANCGSLASLGMTIQVGTQMLLVADSNAFLLGTGFDHLAHTPVWFVLIFPDGWQRPVHGEVVPSSDE